VKKNVVEAIRQTADRLGNTPAIARGSYVHPAVLEAYLAGSIRGALVEAAEEQETPPTSATPGEEAAVRALLRQRLEDDAARSGRGGNGAGRSARTKTSARR
jgi:DNA topoisomerase-1